MTKIVVADLHEAITKAGIPIDGIALLRDGSIRVDYQAAASDEQKVAAQAIVDTYDQDAVDATKSVSLSPVTADDINAAKTVPDLKALLIRMLGEKA